MKKKKRKKTKTIQCKRKLQCFCVLVILSYSLYKKDRNVSPKMFLEKFIHNFFWKSIINLKALEAPTEI